MNHDDLIVILTAIGVLGPILILIFLAVTGILPKWQCDYIGGEFIENKYPSGVHASYECKAAITPSKG